LLLQFGAENSVFRHRFFLLKLSHRLTWVDPPPSVNASHASERE
jgi:hypothetical protein